ncbi:uncharacterized protein LTR77_009457 [Saxophila tyrrhenica]|uniref:Fe2OG dioxygenase domain-containing protein n=1 Tax=Saxophila tyrrhenica TaxID=1690608 RepID=A0AAV9NXY4_9PEZI|nr:hypothetical protein LTR77_009457 [Saxophila tyrrhenica]
MPSKPTKTKKDAAKPTGSAQSVPPRPNWPPISPVLPAADLSLATLLADQVLTISQLWTTSLCKTYVNFLSTLPLTTTPGKPKRGEAVRVNDRFQVDDPIFAERLWSSTALKEIVENPVIDGEALNERQKRELWGGEALGLNSNIRVYRYSKGQYFDQHYDDSNNISFPSTSSQSAVPAKTTWTLLLYLSSPATGCKGGETIFHPEAPSKREAAPPPIVAELEVGMALLHRHGKDCLLHEGREVTEGEKWIIRSDLCVKR